MKLIHTSDWHLGNMLYSHDRADEFLYLFDCLEEIVKDESPDAFLVSGDIFDVSSPSAAVSRMFKDRLLRIHSLSPSMSIIVTAGNHDSASRIDIDRNLWRVGGIHVIGTVRREEGIYDFADNIIRIGDKGYVAAVPFVNGVFMPRVNEEERPQRSFFNAAALAAMRENTEGLPMVLMAHLSVAGCDRTGHRDPQIGGIDSVPDDIFPACFDYVALGHIHRRQVFQGGRVAYSGSPLAMGFDEDYKHTVSVVNVVKGQIPEIRTIEIPPLRRLLTVPPEGADLKKTLRLLSKIPDDEDIYVRPYVVQEEDLPADASELAIAKVGEKKCRLCPFKYEKIKAAADVTLLDGISASEFIESSPVAIAERYFNALGLSENEISSYLEMITGLCGEIDREKNI